MKKLLIGIVVAVVFTTATMLFATDSTHRLDEYASQGQSADYVVGRVLANSDTHTAYWLRNRELTVPIRENFGLAAGGTAVESLYFPALCVPQGYTYYLHSARLAAFQEVNGATTQVTYMQGCWYDSSGATLDTFVSTISIDADSIDYSKVAYPLTLLDTTFAGGDVLWLKVKHTVAAAASGLLGGSVTFNFSVKKN
jgi:hypothetical protein